MVYGANLMSWKRDDKVPLFSYFSAILQCLAIAIYLCAVSCERTRPRVVAVHVTNNIPAAKLYSCTCVYKMIYDRLSDKMEERRRLDNVTSGGYHYCRGKSRSRPDKAKARNMRNGNIYVRGPRSCKTNTYSISYGWRVHGVTG
jgi:hypothetical protein